MAYVDKHGRPEIITAPWLKKGGAEFRRITEEETDDKRSSPTGRRAGEPADTYDDR